ncbi:Gfo/Idh/MocA family oxidoreductase, partial [Candidatus Sumerlaeota bacterium]|nr:Gfo/Idh/MocA family oxidoreductase [Candidatus Sumerlaeota bacterium]
MKQIRIAMLGSGFVAEFYMQGLANVNGQTVVANFSRTPETARALAARWNIPEATTDLDALVSRDDIDLYIIALPNFQHEEVCLKLAAAGRAMVCTKPLGRDAAEARRMMEAVQKAGVFNGYAETEVFAPAVVKAREQVRVGAIGEVLWVRSREAHGGPHKPWFWKKENTGGGALNDMGCHCIEAARYFFGKEKKVRRVMAWGARLTHHGRTDAEDNALMLMEFETGGLAHCELSWSARGGLDLRNEVHGSEGVIFTDVTRHTPITTFSLRGTGYLIEKAE